MPRNILFLALLFFVLLPGTRLLILGIFAHFSYYKVIILQYTTLNMYKDPPHFQVAKVGVLCFLEHCFLVVMERRLLAILKIVANSGFSRDKFLNSLFRIDCSFIPAPQVSDLCILAMGEMPSFNGHRFKAHTEHLCRLLSLNCHHT